MDIFFKKTVILLNLMFIALLFFEIIPYIHTSPSKFEENFEYEPYDNGHTGPDADGYTDESYIENCYVIASAGGVSRGTAETGSSITYKAYRSNDGYYLPLEHIQKIFNGRVLTDNKIRINGRDILYESGNEGYVNLSKLMTDDVLSRHFLSYAFDDGNFVIGRVPLEQFEKAKQFIIVSHTKDTDDKSVTEDYILIKVYADYKGDTSLEVQYMPVKDAIENGIRQLSGLYQNVKYYDENGRTAHVGVFVKWKSQSDYTMQKYINSYVDYYLSDNRSYVNKIGGSDMYLYSNDKEFIHVVLHEFAHLLGLPDGYYEAGKRDRAPRGLAHNYDMMLNVGPNMKISNLHIHMILQYLNGDFVYMKNGEPNISWDVLKYENYMPSAADTEYDKPYNPNNPEDSILKHRNGGKGRPDGNNFTNSNLWYRTVN